MKLSRPSRFVAALIALFSMLFMQLAVATYECPGMGAGPSEMADVSSSIDHRNMDGCTGMDPVQPNLCHAYDHADKQSVDKPELPQIQQFVPMKLVFALSPLDAAARPLSNRPETFLLTRTTAPPLSIRNCCFRI